MLFTEMKKEKDLRSKLHSDALKLAYDYYYSIILFYIIVINYE